MFSTQGFIMTLILGALAGWIASMIMGKDAQMGSVANIIVGIIGSLIGEWIYNVFFLNGTPNTFVQIIWAVIGACILLWIIGLIRKNSNKTNHNNRTKRY